MPLSFVPPTSREGGKAQRPASQETCHLFFACRAGCLGWRSNAVDHKWLIWTGGGYSDGGVGVHHLPSIVRSERLPA
jgi:hypothetical protein